MNLTKLIEERKKLFGEKYGDSFKYGAMVGLDSMESVNSFDEESIRLAYEQGRKDAVEVVSGMCEGMNNGYPEHREKGSAEFEKAEMLRGQGYNTALSDIQSKLTEMLGDKK